MPNVKLWNYNKIKETKCDEQQNKLSTAMPKPNMDALNSRHILWCLMQK